jgi:hypothetical protein
MEAVGRFQIPQDALVGDIEGIGARIAQAYMERWENRAEDDPWLALVRSSLSHEGSYQLLRSVLEAQQAAPLSTVLGSAGDGPRSAMVECMIAGMIMTRYIYRLEPARSLPAAAFEAAFANSLQQAISGPAPAAAASPVPRAPKEREDRTQLVRPSRSCAGRRAAARRGQGSGWRARVPAGDAVPAEACGLPLPRSARRSDRSTTSRACRMRPGLRSASRLVAAPMPLRAASPWRARPFMHPPTRRLA